MTNFRVPTLARGSLIEIVFRALLVILVFGFLAHACSLMAQLRTDQPKPTGRELRGGQGQSAETRLALMEREDQEKAERIRRLEEDIRFLNATAVRLDKELSAQAAVSAALKDTSYLLGSGFVAQLGFAIGRAVIEKRRNGNGNGNGHGEQRRG